MTEKEILDSVSDSLMCDERVLSLQEKELLTSLLQRARTNPSVSNATVTTAMARVAGEMVAQRACEILSSSIAQRLLDQTPASSPIRAAIAVDAIPQVFPPLPPPPTPPSGPPKGIWQVESDSVGAQPRAVFPPLPPPPTPPSGPPKGIWQAQREGAANVPRTVFPPLPPPPTPPSGPPHLGLTVTRPAEDNLTALDKILPAQCVILDEFLAPAELDALLRYALEHEQDFQVSEVLSPGGPGMVDYEHRQSRVLFDLGNSPATVVDRIHSCLPRILPKLGRGEFSISQIEAQITASNDGDFFRSHQDNGHAETATREVTFVYFFHREPKAFSGGELRIYDTRRENGGYIPTKNYRVITPQQNQIVLFASSLAHEITPVTCASRAFADSRFTLNGWLRRKERRLYATA
jgi:Rps23 Pro-64 3,4-dihydroxylase Tpa1-like proline 4-hydroxylase